MLGGVKARAASKAVGEAVTGSAKRLASAGTPTKLLLAALAAGYIHKRGKNKGKLEVLNTMSALSKNREKNSMDLSAMADELSSITGVSKEASVMSTAKGLFRTAKGVAKDVAKKVPKHIRSGAGAGAAAGGVLGLISSGDLAGAAKGALGGAAAGAGVKHLLKATSAGRRLSASLRAAKVNALKGAKP